MEFLKYFAWNHAAREGADVTLTLRRRNGERTNENSKGYLLEQDNIDSNVYEWNGATAVFPGFWHKVVMVEKRKVFRVR